jgi:hypothetical protein
LTGLSSEQHLDRGPADIELVKETNLPDFADWLINVYGGSGNLPEHIVTRLRDEHLLENDLAPLLRLKKVGDGLWLCRSRKRDPSLATKVSH